MIFRSLLLVALLGTVHVVTALASAPVPAPSAEKIRVVATLPDLAAIAEAIGGDRITVKALARPGQNLHAVRVKPSHLVALSKADLFIQVGLSLEHAWVPGLIQTARNRRVLPGTNGFVSAGDDYTMIEVPVRIDRSLSVDVHPQGNPHINLSLGGGPHMAERILAGLIRVDPSGKEAYQAGYRAWMTRYQAARARWDVIAKAVALKGRDACLYHQEFDYLLGEMGLTIAAFLEPRPGLAPTPSHLGKVIQIVKDKRIPTILTAPWSHNKHCKRVAKLTGASILELPVMSGGSADHATWIKMMDDVVGRVAAAYGVDVKAALSAAAAVDTSEADNNLPPR